MLMNFYKTIKSESMIYILSTPAKPSRIPHCYGVKISLILTKDTTAVMYSRIQPRCKTHTSILDIIYSTYYCLISEITYNYNCISYTNIAKQMF